MTDQIQNSLTIEQILELAGKVETWIAPNYKKLEDIESCSGRLKLDSKSIFSSLEFVLTPHKSFLLKKVSCIDLHLTYTAAYGGDSILGRYYNVDWPIAIQVYVAARENAFKNNLSEEEKRKQEGIDYAKSLLEKK